ncbi:MAG: hypothetical protein U9N49_07830 [Campylobacterota bacterium]|nr:hypothetical protein [Campylobacterota bacterium]
MNYKHYKIELILGASLLFMVLSYGYKTFTHSSLKNSQEELVSAKAQINEIIALQELWGDKKTTKKVKALEKVLPTSKVASFSVKGKKLTALFKDMGIGELNRLTGKITSLAVSIDKFNLTQEAKGYRLEIKCKW